MAKNTLKICGGHFSKNQKFSNGKVWNLEIFESSQVYKIRYLAGLVLIYLRKK